MKLFALKWRAMLALLMTGSLVVVTAFGMQAHAQTTSTMHPAAARYCTVLLDHLHQGEKQSRVLSSQCSKKPQESKSGTLLLRVFVDANYGGAHYDFRGAYGPCEASGYSWDSMPSGFTNTISSFKVFNNCMYTRVYKENDFSGTCVPFSGNVRYVGDAINDQISSIRVSSEKQSC